MTCMFVIDQNKNIGCVDCVRYTSKHGHDNDIRRQLPAFGFLMLGFGFVVIGAATFANRALFMQKTLHLRRSETAFMVAHSTFGLLAWLASASYLITDGFSNKKLMQFQYLVVRSSGNRLLLLFEVVTDQSAFRPASSVGVIYTVCGIGPRVFESLVIYSY
mgnify:CR=1 FL=1